MTLEHISRWLEGNRLEIRDLRVQANKLAESGRSAPAESRDTVESSSAGSNKRVGKASKPNAGDGVGGNERPSHPGRGFDWGPFAKLPDCRQFTISVGEGSKIYKFFGIKKREEPTISIEPWKNSRYNRYAWYTINRLRSTSSDQLFWMRAKVVLERSKVFALMSLARAFPRYHRELPLRLVIAILLNAFSIAKERRTEIKYSRTYIPKPGNKWRPLGVPSPEWRVYLSTFNGLLVTRFGHLVPDWQHGSVPGKGTLTAWKEIMVSVVKAKYIYEFDLKNFFGSVDVERTLGILESNGMDPSFLAQLRGIASMQPKLPAERPLDETSEVAKNFGHGTVNQVWTRGIIPDGWRVVKRTPTGGISVVFDEEMLAKLSKTSSALKGWPQGANFSPFLSVLSLHGLRAMFAKLIMYVDDGVFYSNRKFTSEQVVSAFRAIGLEIAPEKSHGVKYGGIWARPLKFLGLTYNGVLNQLGSSTRSGVSALFDKEELFTAVQHSRKMEHLASTAPWRVEPLLRRVGHGLAHPDRNSVVEFIGATPQPPGYRFGEGRSVLLEYVVYGQGLDEFKSYASKSEALTAKAELTEAYPDVYGRVARVTPEGLVLALDVERSNSGSDLVRSRFFGGVQSRLYEGKGNANVFQDFSLSFTKSSGVSKRARRFDVELDFANSTSFAASDIINLLSFTRRKAWAKSQFLKGNWTFRELNEWRRSVGLPAYSWAWYRAVKKAQRVPLSSVAGAAAPVFPWCVDDDLDGWSYPVVEPMWPGCGGDGRFRQPSGPVGPVPLPPSDYPSDDWDIPAPAGDEDGNPILQF